MTTAPHELSADTARWRVTCDGAARPNRGPIAVGITLRAGDGTVHTISRAPAARGCGNEAEAWALLVALEEAHALGARALDVTTDSAVVVDEVNGKKRTKVARLARLFTRVRVQIARFDDVTVRWVPRHRNAEADALARAALPAPP